MAEVLKASESGYYKWLQRLTAPPTEKEMEDIRLAEEIFEIYSNSRGSYGSRKITIELNKKREKKINHKRVERLMGEYELYSKVSKRYVSTTDSNHSEPIAEELLGRDFTAEKPNEKMVSDTTVVSTGEGNLYAAGILDLCGRMPVGLAVSQSNDSKLVSDAFRDMTLRGVGAPGCILHSDRGSTYASKVYRTLIAEGGFICSMSHKGDCWDNAPMESFWGKMKSEWLRKKYDTIDEAKRDIYEYFWHFYPLLRPHQSNYYLTPFEYYEQAKNR